MRSIYKYSFMNSKDGIIEGPITKLLTAQVQHGNMVVWAEVDTEKPNRKFQIMPIGTGWPLDPPAGKECILDSHTYLSTVQMGGGSLIFHIYAKEIVPAPVKAKIPEPVKKAVAKNAFGGTFEVSTINPEVLAFFTK